MTNIQAGEFPPEALLEKYAREEAYTDCYFMDMPRAVSLEQYVEAFYTTPLFKAERCLLALALKPSTDLKARQLAQGQTDDFAVWTVVSRLPQQLLLQDLTGRIRSWFMVAPHVDGAFETTRLYFGSAVLPLARSPGQPPKFGLAFDALFGFHRLYTRALMAAARAKLSHQTNPSPTKDAS